MRYVLIQLIMQQSKRLRSRLHLRAPTEKSGPRRKDSTGFMFVLLLISLFVAVWLLA
ncbi:MAG: hypothetical protein WBJ21_11050 [Burkholderiaceae bacterium]